MLSRIRINITPFLNAQIKLLSRKLNFEHRVCTYTSYRSKLMTMYIEVQVIRLNIFFFSGHIECNFVETNMGENNSFLREPESYLLKLQAFLFLRILNSENDVDIQIGLKRFLPDQIILSAKYKNKLDVASPYKKTYIIALKKRSDLSVLDETECQDLLMQSGCLQYLLQHEFFKNRGNIESTMEPDQNCIIVSDIKVNGIQFIQKTPEEKNELLKLISTKDNITSYKIKVNEANQEIFKKKIMKKFKTRISKRDFLAKKLIISRMTEAETRNKSLDERNKISPNDFNALFDQSILDFVQDKNEAKFSEAFVCNQIPTHFSGKELSDWSNFRETFGNIWKNYNQLDCWETIKKARFSVTADFKKEYNKKVDSRPKCFLPSLDTSEPDDQATFDSLAGNLEFVFIDNDFLESKKPTEPNDIFIDKCLLDWLKDMKNKAIRIQEIETAINVISHAVKNDLKLTENMHDVVSMKVKQTKIKEKINEYLSDETLTNEQQQPVYGSAYARTFLERWGTEIIRCFSTYIPTTNATTNSGITGIAKKKFLETLKTKITSKDETIKEGLEAFKNELQKTFSGTDVAEKWENTLPELCKISLENYPILCKPLHNSGDLTYSDPKEINMIVKCLKNMEIIKEKDDEEKWNYMFITYKCLHQWQRT